MGIVWRALINALAIVVAAYVVNQIQPDAIQWGKVDYGMGEMGRYLSLILTGLTLDVTGAHLARAALESVAFQTQGLVAAMSADGYDDPALLAAVRPYMVKMMRAQLAFGARRDVAVVLGTGKNYDFLTRLNAEQGFFERLEVVEHPRFIMQYRRPQVKRFVDKYETLLRPLSHG